MTQPPFPPRNSPQDSFHQGHYQSGPAYGGPPYDGQNYATAQPQTEPPKKKFIVGLIATVLAVLGTFLACIPAIFFVGWIVLFAAFVTAIVSLLLSNHSKAWGIVALVLSVIGSIIGAIVFFAFMATTLIDSLPDDTDPSTENPVVGTTVRPDGGEETPVATATYDTSPNEFGVETLPEGALGSHTNPMPINSTLQGPDWTVDFANLNFDGTEELRKLDPSYAPPEEGRTYLVFDVTMKYSGDQPDGVAAMGLVYMDPGAFNTSHAIFDATGLIDVLTPFQPGEERTGKLAVSVPTENPEDGQFVVLVPGTETPIYMALK